MLELNRLYHMDCMEGMKDIPDAYFELAICDPPYGIGMDGQHKSTSADGKKYRKYKERRGWDASIPDGAYFAELERVSQNQIIWGGNYFVPHLRRGTRGWIVWDKGQHGLSMSDCELAYSSFDVPTRVVVINRGELSREDTFHPTQKPVKLYSWLLSRYAQPGWKILDTHAGSAASLIACYRAGFDYMGFEIDGEYFEKAQARIDTERSQLRIFDFIEGRDGW